MSEKRFDLSLPIELDKLVRDRAAVYDLKVRELLRLIILSYFGDARAQHVLESYKEMEKVTLL